jgi:hypothetical protein
MGAARDNKPESLPPPPEELSPAMREWADSVRDRHRDLHSAYSRLRDTLIESEIGRSQRSKEGPDYVPLKTALAHAPHVHPEFGRRLCANRDVDAAQNGKGGRWRVSLASFLKVVRERLG